MARALPVSDEDQLSAFLSLPAVGAVELHLTDAKRPPTKQRSKKLRAMDVADDVLVAFDGDLTDNSSSNLVSRLELAWVGQAGVLSQAVMTAEPESYQRALTAARQPSVGVRLHAYDDAQPFSKSEQRGTLYLPRTIEKLQAGRFQHQVVDTPELFDASIGAMHKPGVVSRKVLRKDAVHVFEQYRQDAEWTRIDVQTKKDLTTFECRNSEFLGFVRCGLWKYVLSTTEIQKVRQEFTKNTNFGRWASDRLMMRLGI